MILPRLTSEKIQMKSTRNWKALPLLGLPVVAAASQAQSRSSFLSPDSLSGVTVSKSTNLDYTVSLAAGSTVTINGVTDTVTDVFGFWL